MYTQTLLQQTGGAGKDDIRCRCADNNKIYFARVDTGCGNRLECSMFCQVTGRFIFCGNVPFNDAGACLNPLIRSIDNTFKFAIGHDLLWQVTTRAGNS